MAPSSEAQVSLDEQHYQEARNNARDKVSCQVGSQARFRNLDKRQDIYTDRTWPTTPWNSPAKQSVDLRPHIIERAGSVWARWKVYCLADLDEGRHCLVRRQERPRRRTAFTPYGNSHKIRSMPRQDRQD